MKIKGNIKIMEYKAAAIVFYRLEKGVVHTFLGLEEGKGWRHFGGKIEPCDENDPMKTMIREVSEETENQLLIHKKHIELNYDKNAKMVVFYHSCSRGFQKVLGRLKPTKVKQEYRWMNINDEQIPKYIAHQLNILKLKFNTVKPPLKLKQEKQEKMAESKIIVVQATDPVDIFIMGVAMFRIEHYDLLNSREKYFLDVFASKHGSASNSQLLNIMVEWAKQNLNDNGRFLNLFTINGVDAVECCRHAKYANSVNELFKDV